MDFEIRYAYDQRQYIRVVNQLVPRYALRQRGEDERGHAPSVDG